MFNKRAFSLIELSIVVLIIGILIAGVTQGSRLIQESKISTARTLTQSSDINSIKDLVVWFDSTDEATLKTSAVSDISTTEYSNIDDGDLISSWIDKNPQLTRKIEVTADSDIRRPTYKRNGINGLPSLKFIRPDWATADALSSVTDMPLKESDDSYTMVAVWQSEFGDNNDVIVIQSAPSYTTSNRAAGIYTTSGGIIFWGYQNNVTLSVPGYNSTAPHIAIIRVNNNNLTNNVSFSFDGYDTTGTSANVANLDLGVGNFSIGGADANAAFPYVGLVSEVIIFDRFLKDSEVQNIENYLSRKYSIALN